jgi:hypothetical protein
MYNISEPTPPAQNIKNTSPTSALQPTTNYHPPHHSSGRKRTEALHEDVKKGPVEGQIQQNRRGLSWNFFCFLIWDFSLKFCFHTELSNSY